MRIAMDEAHESPDLPPMRIKCPECSEGTTSLKRYGVLHYVVFLGIAARWRRGSFTACPKCVRKKLLKDTVSPLNILSANLMWLLAVLPYNLGLMIASTIPGHSKSVVDLIEKKWGYSVKGGKKKTPPVDAETLRQAALDSVLALKRENTPRVGDPSFTSHTGYNYGRWAEKGFNIAVGLLEYTKPEAGETGSDYLGRIKELVRAQRDEYRGDEADEDGACSGALDAAMWAITGAKPKVPAARDRPEQQPSEPAPKAGKERSERPWGEVIADAEWQVFYEDMFDRECPPSVTANGRGIESGLIELWKRFLFETVQAGGKKSFSRFYLWWEQGSAAVDGDWNGATRLREWVSADKKQSRGEGDAGLLEKIAHTHERLLRSGRSSEGILAAAAASENSKDFEARLSGLTER